MGITENLSVVRKKINNSAIKTGRNPDDIKLVREDHEKTRPYFKRLRDIRDNINEGREMRDKLQELSMGMSNDFEIAIEEGATIVRIGTAIFGERK